MNAEVPFSESNSLPPKNKNEFEKLLLFFHLSYFFTPHNFPQGDASPAQNSMTIA